MKTLVRAFALSLVVTGAVASMHTQTVSVPVKTSAIPVPLCPPSDSKACTDQMGY